MPETTIRPATKIDQQPVGDLWMAFLEEQAASDARLELVDDLRERFDNDFPLWVEDGTQRTLVAEREGDEGERVLVGFATAHRWGTPPIYVEAPEVFVDEFYVHPEARRQGVGRQLAGALRAWADEVEADRLRLRVVHTNDAGRAFWESVGAAPFATTLTMELERTQETQKQESRKIGF